MNTKRALSWAIAGGIVGASALNAIQRRREISLEGKSVVITGGSRGLGLILAREMADQGARIAILARDEDELRIAREDIASRGAEIVSIPCDLRNQDDAMFTIETAARELGSIDVLINNAGVIQSGPIEHMKIADFEDAMKIHFWAPLYTILAALPHMRAQGGGRIVNISSIGGKIAVPHLVPYAASKFALTGLSNGLQAELAKDKIYVTTVYPGLMRTGSTIQAGFKGRHQVEYAWFALLDSLPLVSISAKRAARKIVDACKKGKPQLTITPQAKMAIIFDALLPDTFSEVMMLTAEMLPGPTSAEGDELWSGEKSKSDILPGFLTALSEKAATKNNERVRMQIDTE
ncbi:MAG TPA: SDR family oxidoreductase [Blastocatellia bacterium]|nr:SDR family oxidoreductase [Blastocatellia bacterium]